MPTCPLRPCSHVGCAELVVRGKCAKHKAIRERATSNSRGYDYRWQRASKAYLYDHPLCYYCRKRGRITPATSVDHKTPPKGDYLLFWDTANWAPACASCNSAKGDRTAEEFLATT